MYLSIILIATPTNMLQDSRQGLWRWKIDGYTCFMFNLMLLVRSDLVCRLPGKLCFYLLGYGILQKQYTSNWLVGVSNDDTFLQLRGVATN